MEREGIGWRASCYLSNEGGEHHERQQVDEAQGSRTGKPTGSGGPGGVSSTSSGTAERRGPQPEGPEALRAGRLGGAAGNAQGRGQALLTEGPAMARLDRSSGPAPT